MLSPRDSGPASHVILMSRPISGPLVYTSCSTLLGTAMWIMVKFCHYNWSRGIWVIQSPECSWLARFLCILLWGSWEDAKRLLHSSLLEMCLLLQENTEEIHHFSSCRNRITCYTCRCNRYTASQKAAFSCSCRLRRKEYTKRYETVQWGSLQLLDKLGQKITTILLKLCSILVWLVIFCHC